MSFWPADINAEEILPPRDIMHAAGIELENRTGILNVMIVESKLDDRVVLAFELTNEESSRTLNLFEASHRIKECYPVAINPPNSDVPEFLRRKRYVPGQPGALEGSSIGAFHRVMQGTQGRYVDNEWVCATPTEFRTKLTDLFAKDSVKSRIVSLMASTKSEDPTNAEAEASEDVQHGDD